MILVFQMLVLDTGIRSEPLMVREDNALDVIAVLEKIEEPENKGVIVIGEYQDDELHISCAPILNVKRFTKIIKERATNG